jgi:hypothetical protein
MCLEKSVIDLSYSRSIAHVRPNSLHRQCAVLPTIAVCTIYSDAATMHALSPTLPKIFCNAALAHPSHFAMRILEDLIRLSINVNTCTQRVLPSTVVASILTWESKTTYPHQVLPLSSTLPHSHRTPMHLTSRQALD